MKLEKSWGKELSSFIVCPLYTTEARTTSKQWWRDSSFVLFEPINMIIQLTNLNPTCIQCWGGFLTAIRNTITCVHMKHILRIYWDSLRNLRAVYRQAQIVRITKIWWRRPNSIMFKHKMRAIIYNEIFQVKFKVSLILEYVENDDDLCKRLSKISHAENAPLHILLVTCFIKISLTTDLYSTVNITRNVQKAFLQRHCLEE